MPEPEPLPLPEPDKLEPDEPEPEPEPPPGPMAEFDEAAVLVWLGTVPGVTAAQRAAAAEMLAEDEYDGSLLVGATAKTLGRLLKGTAAEGAVPLLLAIRDKHLAAEPLVAAGCQICFETYGSARPSLRFEQRRCYK